jgi:hypothetical protein
MSFGNGERPQNKHKLREQRQLLKQPPAMPTFAYAPWQPNATLNDTNLEKCRQQMCASQRPVPVHSESGVTCTAVHQAWSPPSEGPAAESD